MNPTDFRQYLPSKKVVIPLVGSLLILGGVIWWQQPSSGGSEGIATSELKRATDSDNDGLSDWKEKLWKTDPQEKDTDGDGTSDGEEVKKNRDPTAAGNDKLTALERDNIEEGSRQGLNTNQTDQLFSKILPSAVLIAEKQKKGEGTKLTSKQVNQVIAQTQKSINPEGEKKPYTPEDINAVKSTKESRKQYSQNLFAALSSVSQKQFGDELQLFAQAVKGENPKKKYEQMKKIAEAYTNMNQKLLEMEVPENFLDQHVQVVNNYYLIALSIEEMTRVKEDPVRALAAIERYRKIIRKNSEIFYQIGQRLNQDLEY